MTVSACQGLKIALVPGTIGYLEKQLSERGVVGLDNLGREIRSTRNELYRDIANMVFWIAIAALATSRSQDNKQIICAIATMKSLSTGLTACRLWYVTLVFQKVVNTKMHLKTE